jgi:zinc transport system substrate-binding protein
VGQLVGDEARIEVILPPGASPATFDVTPRQLADMRASALFVLVGGGLDEWTTKLSDEGTPLVRLSEGISLIQEEEHGVDDGHDHGHSHASGNPHIWLDPILVRDDLLPKLDEALQLAFPQGAQGIHERAGALADSLTALDQEIRAALAPLKNRAFISTHAAWSYYARRYDLDEAGVIHASPGHEPSSREVADLLRIAEEKQIGCLFIEPQLGEVAARALATELSLPVSLLDPLGGPDLEGRDSYLALLRFNTRQLVDGLGTSGK